MRPTGHLRRFTDIVWRAPVCLLLVGVFSVLAGCTALISEKPIFKSGDYDTGDSLLGYYVAEEKEDPGFEVLVTRGPDARLVALGFLYKAAERAENQNSPTEDQKILTQVFYAEGAAIALGGGDHVLQVACFAIIRDGKFYASEIGGRDSPFRAYTAYGIIAKDRREDYGWLTVGFDNEQIADKYGIKKDTKEGRTRVYRARIIPSGITRPAAVSLFHDLIELEMTGNGSSLFFKRMNRDPQLTEVEKRAIVLNDSKACYRVQMEGDPPP